MPIQVAKTIPVDARHTLVRNRDMIQSNHGVQMYFPKSLVRGANQDMILKGGPNAIARAEREIDVILGTWRGEFEAFKARRAFRKNRDRMLAAAEGVEKFPMLAKAEVKVKKELGGNGFSALLNEDEVNSALDVVVGPKPTTKSKEPVLKGWAVVAAKKPVMVESAPIATNTTVVEDFEKVKLFEFPPLKPFDWADAVDEEDGGDDVWDNWE